MKTKKLGLLFILFFCTLVRAETLMVEVKVSQGQHNVVRVWTVEGNFQDRSRPSSQGGLWVNLWRGEQRVRQYEIADPTKFHSPLLANGEEADHDDLELDEALYHMRIPAEQGITKVTIEHTQSTDLNARSMSGRFQEPVLNFVLPSLTW